MNAPAPAAPTTNASDPAAPTTNASDPAASATNAPAPAAPTTNASAPAASRRPRRFPFFRVETFLFFAVPAALLAAFFFRPLIENERFAYRDVGYFYYPLFEQIQNEWERGRLPLWDPFENLGQPLAGNPTSSVFYPGKAIFFLSSAGCVDFNACFSFYIIWHPYSIR